MKLKRIHLSEDRVLSSENMKFVMGGGDNNHQKHDGSFMDCSDCKKLRDSINNAGVSANGYQGQNELVYLMQGIGYLMGAAYHYGYQLYQNVVGDDEENEDKKDSNNKDKGVKSDKK